MGSTAEKSNTGATSLGVVSLGVVSAAVVTGADSSCVGDEQAPTKAASTASAANSAETFPVTSTTVSGYIRRST